MANGELQFEAPWQARLFGMAVSLAEAGVFSWDEFREQLIRAIGERDDDAEPGEGYEYYQHFETALVAVLNEKGIDLDHALLEKAEAFAARPHGHDH